MGINDKLEIFCENLRYCREAMGLTQKTLAEKAGIAPATVSAYEKKTKFPSLENAIALANVLDVTVGMLCGESYASRDPQTFSDLIQMVRVLESQGQGYHVEDILTFENGVEKKYRGICFFSRRMNCFLEDWERISKMLAEDIIDDELYEAWFEKQLRKYDIPLGEDIEDDNIPEGDFANKVLRSMSKITLKLGVKPTNADDN